MHAPTSRENSSDPAYLRIADELRSLIVQGELATGDRLPAERELVERFNVARMTVRHALALLQAEGLIDRKRGRYGGTFVNSTPPVIELSNIHGILPQLREKYRTVESRVLKAESTTACGAVAEALELEPGEEVINISRLRVIEDTPMLLENSHFPAKKLPRLLEADLTQSLYELLEQYDRRPVWKEETVVPGRASAEEKEILDVPHNRPLLRILRTARDSVGEVVEYSEDVMRSDSARIKVITDVRRTP